MRQKTLCELFESNKTILEQKLKGKTLPKDSSNVQEAVSSYIKTVFDSEGEFRQHLTQSEDYILEAAISLLNAQQKISSVLIKEVDKTAKKSSSSTIEDTIGSAQDFRTDPKYTLGGVAGGALLGKVIFGGWGGVFGAIAGVAISVYLSSKKQQRSPKTTMVEDINKPIDIECFIAIIHDVCESVDNLISIFRSQINRVVQKYESQEKSSLDKEYRILLESIQTLVGYERNREITEEKYIKKLQERIEDLADSLDNYDITLENYSEEKSSWFDKVSSPNTKELKEVFPAVVKKDILIIPGKVFIPE